MEIEDTLKKIKAEVASATEQRIRAEVEKSRAEESIATSMELLQTKFKCDSIESAKDLMSKLEASIESKLQDAQKLLSEV